MDEKDICRQWYVGIVSAHIGHQQVALKYQNLQN
jgi:hypothetical protein